MNVEIKIGGRGSIRLEVWNAAAMAEVAQATVEAVRARTQGSISADGSPFPLGARGQTVRLWRTGYMLSSMDVKKYDANGAIIRSDAEYAGDVSSIGPGRYPFMGIDPNTENLIAQKIAEVTERLITSSAQSAATRAALSGLF